MGLAPWPQAWMLVQTKFAYTSILTQTSPPPGTLWATMERNVLCKTYPVQRALGHSAVAGAAYRAGQNLTERARAADQKDKVHRYAGRALTVRETFILTPEGAPSWASDRAELWNRVEENEKRKNSRVGREVQLGLAYELEPSAQRALVKEFANREFVAKGFVVDVAIHNYGGTIPTIGGDDEQQAKLREWARAGVPFLERTEATQSHAEHVIVLRDRAGQVTGYKHYQPHAHLRIAPRPFEDGAFARTTAASREFDRHETAMNWRYEWPKLHNSYLERAGSDARVRSTGSEEEGFEHVPRLGDNGRSQVHAIEQRRHELSSEELQKHEAALEAVERDRVFKAVHNETIRQAFLDEHTETDGEERAEREQIRLAAWWRNMSDRFHQWGSELRDYADTWRTRFEQQKDRLQSLLGGRHAPKGETLPGDDGPPPLPGEAHERERDR